MGNFKSTETSMDLLMSAKLTPDVKIGEDGNIALFSVAMTRKDKLCPAQGKLIRETINEFHSQLAAKIEPPVVLAATDDDLADTMETALNRHLEENGTTVQKEYEQFLDTKLGNYNEYKRTNKFFM